MSRRASMTRTRATVAATVLGACLATCAPAAAATPVNVFPIPGGRVASPHTQISFRGIAPSALGPITVTGSRSGAHPGRLVNDSDGEGASFLPARPFAAGETVTVHTSLDIVGGRSGAYTFTVATPAGPIRAGTPLSAPRVPGDISRFRSAPQLFAPNITVTHLPRGAYPGDLFLAPQAGPVQRGPEIFGPYGGLMWFKSVPAGQTATDFRTQTYRGQTVLTWWQGTVNGGVGTGQDEIYSSHYQPLATVTAANGLRSDLHEFQLTRQSTALITAYYPVFWNASSVKGASSHQLVYDAVAQEIDIPTGNVLFQWDSLDHVPVNQSEQPVPGVAGHPWDYFHINAISQMPNSDILISARNTWAAYDVSHATGRIVWTLGGRASSFRMGPNTPFMFQHDVKPLSSDQLTVFDDGAGPPVVHKRSRGITLQLDLARRTVTLVRQDEHQPGLLAFYEGSVERMPNGDDFVGWGGVPFLTEFNSRGRPVFDARFVGQNSSYRAFREPWTGMPVTRPSAAGTVSGSRTTVYASWNGATQVASWRVLAGASPTTLRPAGSGRRAAFETAITVAGRAAYVATQALDGRGRTLGTSKPVKVS